MSTWASSFGSFCSTASKHWNMAVTWGSLSRKASPDRQQYVRRLDDHRISSNNKWTNETSHTRINTYWCSSFEKLFQWFFILVNVWHQHARRQKPTVVVFPRVSKVPEQRSELGGEHVNLQAVEEPALGLVALASTLHPGAQHGLQVTELGTEIGGRERQRQLAEKDFSLRHHSVRREQQQVF